MLKRILSLVVIGLLLNLVFYSSVAASSKPKEAEFAAKVKAAIYKLGIGPDARIEVKLRDKTNLKGYIGEVNENGFMVVDEKIGIATYVAYPQVKKVKGRNNLSGEKIAIGIFIATLIVIGILYGTDRIED